MIAETVNWWNEGTATGLIILVATTLISGALWFARFQWKMRDDINHRVGVPNGHGNLSQVAAKTYDELELLTERLDRADSTHTTTLAETAAYRVNVQTQITALGAKVDGLAGCIKSLARQIERDCGKGDASGDMTASRGTDDG